MKTKRYAMIGIILAVMSICPAFSQLWAESVNLAPAGPVTPATYDGKFIDPADNRLVMDFKDIDVTLLPAFVTPESDIGKAASTVLYIHAYETGAYALMTGYTGSLDAAFVCDLFDEVFPMSALEGLSFDVYYGYSLADGTLRYSAYRVILIRSFKDIVYVSENPQERQNLDIYYPEGIAHPTVLVFVAGGAWRQGDKELYEELARTFSGFYSYTTVVINYRLSNPVDGAAVHPDHIEDVAAAYAWVKSHIASYGGDTQGTYIFGQSAGAHLVSLLCTDSSYLKVHGLNLSDVRAAVSMSGPYNLYDFSQYPMNPLGLTAEEVLMYKVMLSDAFGGWDQQTLDSASPWQFVNKNQPPMLVISTENDMPGLEKESVNFVNYVQRLGLGVSVESAKLLISDYSAETWATAKAMAEAEPAVSKYVGHYAEMVAINTAEYNSRSTRLVVDFMAAH